MNAGIVDCPYCGRPGPVSELRCNICPQCVAAVENNRAYGRVVSVARKIQLDRAVAQAIKRERFHRALAAVNPWGDE